MKLKKQTLLLIGFLVAILFLVGKVVLNRFEAPGESTQKVQFRVGEDAELEGVISNLHYYGFIKNKTALNLALRFEKDKTPGNENSIQVGNHTIDRQTVYDISQDMSAWQLAKVMLNEGRFEDCSHGCPPGLFYPALLPGGELKPSEYEWVETYEDCVKAKGQLSSEQYSQRTGEPRKCVIPDGRMFTEGQEGWEEAKGG